MNNIIKISSTVVKSILIAVATVVSTICVFYDGTEAWKDWTLLVWILCLVKSIDMFDSYWDSKDKKEIADKLSKKSCCGCSAGKKYGMKYREYYK